MNNWNNRTNALFTFASSMMFVLLGLNALTRPFLHQPPSLQVQMGEVTAFRRNYGAGGDAALLTFDLKGDLRPSWNWNTKQFFVYVYVQYKTKKNIVNQVIIWDRIINDLNDAVFDEKQVRAEYIFADQGYNLRNIDFKLHVGWDMTPITGILVRNHTMPGVHATMPDDYL